MRSSRYTYLPHIIRRATVPPYIRLPDNVRPRYNIAPQQKAMVVRSVNGIAQCQEMTWGFKPSWMHDERRAQPAARAQNIFWSLMFRDSTLNRRCLVLATGWYEWDGNDREGQPYYFHRRDDGLICFAGIWTPSASNSWTEEDPSFAIITADADRSPMFTRNLMPVILPEYEYEAWLNPHNHDVGRLEKALRPHDMGGLVHYPVAQYVNNPNLDSEKCIEPLVEFRENPPGARRHL